MRVRSSASKSSEPPKSENKLLTTFGWQMVVVPKIIKKLLETVAMRLDETER